MPISVRDFKSRVIGKIKEKFEIKEAPGRTHDFIEIWYQDKKVCETHYSHGSEGKDIDDSILSKIKRQLKLDRMEQPTFRLLKVHRI